MKLTIKNFKQEVCANRNLLHILALSLNAMTVHRKKLEIVMGERNFFFDPYFFYRHKKTGRKISEQDYHDKLSFVMNEDHDVFRDNYEFVYSPEVYLEQVYEIQRLASVLDSLGFKTKVKKDRSYKKPKSEMGRPEVPVLIISLR